MYPLAELHPACARRPGADRVLANAVAKRRLRPAPRRQQHPRPDPDRRLGVLSPGPWRSIADARELQATRAGPATGWSGWWAALAGGWLSPGAGNWGRREDAAE